jgi:DNA invertase Pin-like site-specific DNA recombinase
METAVYIRVSTEEQDAKNQLGDMMPLIVGEYEVYEDRQSAWKDNVERVSFERLRKDIQARRVKSLYVWDLDRLYRNRQKLVEFFAFCKVYGCAVHSFRQKWLEDILKMPQPFCDIMHSLLLQIMGWLAQDESDKKSKRVKSAIRKKDGETISYKGNKWGRKSVSKNVIEQVLDCKQSNPNASIREIASLCYQYDKHGNKKPVSKSVVHKILKESCAENNLKEGCL